MDCLVSPTMGEGFGYPGLQCMAMGVPVIITNFSGCQDYANAETATLLEPDGFLLKQEMDGIPQFRAKKWAFVSVKKIQKAMRYVLTHPEEAKLKAAIAYSAVRQQFNFEKVSRLFSEMIRELYG
jgi:glycosyltransferase involved in cell wall biosynthesis